MKFNITVSGNLRKIECPKIKEKLQQYNIVYS